VGNSITVHPVKIVFTQTLIEQKFPIKAMFVVPKKNFKKAHDRNKLKRRMKEVYRLCKHNLYLSKQLQSKNLLISYIFIGKTASEYSELETCIEALNKKIENFNFKPV
jgi:ribonuclease P protein component